MTNTSYIEVPLLLSADHGSAEHVFDKMRVEYRYVPASRGMRERGGLQIEPDEAEGIEIGNVFAIIDGARNPVPEWMIEPLIDQLSALCLEDAIAERHDAADRRYEEQRDRLMEERFGQRAAE